MNRYFVFSNDIWDFSFQIMYVLLIVKGLDIVNIEHFKQNPFPVWFCSSYFIFWWTKCVALQTISWKYLKLYHPTSKNHQSHSVCRVWSGMQRMKIPENCYNCYNICKPKILKWKSLSHEYISDGWMSWQQWWCCSEAHE